MSGAQESADTGREGAEQTPGAEFEADQLIVAVLPYIGCERHLECRGASAEMMGRLAEEQDEAWSRSVNRALFKLHLEVLSHQSWPGGWQPADLARVAKRELGPVGRAAITDLMYAELRSYAPATIDEIWHDQLADLGGRVWWSEDATYVRELAEAKRLDRPQVLDLLVRLLQVVARLPQLEALTALPGKARSAPSRWTIGRQRASGSGGGKTDEKLLSRVRALLAKAESTTYEAEAETFTAAAQAMMARHSIDEALLWERRDGHHEERPSGIRLTVDNPYADAKAMLLHQIAQANRCRAVWTKQQGFSTVLGYRPDTAWVELLYTSLLVQATRVMTIAGSKSDAYGSRTRAFRTSFLESFALRIGERLREATEQAEAEARDEAGAAIEGGAGATRDLVPVLADRLAAVEETMARVFPEGTSTSKRRSSWSYDREGWASGRSAADLADLARGQTLGPGSA
jgi:hypothetical protein